jgi:LuxR family transcriptional regulator, regulator of acetate metabolism
VCALSSSDEPRGGRAIDRMLVELLALEREIIELEYVRRSDALERIRDAIRRLGEIGSPRGILDRAADELGHSSGFDRVLISEVRDRSLEPRSIFSSDEDPSDAEAALEQLRAAPIRLEYPVIEEEIAARQQVALVDVRGSRSRGAPRLAEMFGWHQYVVAALTVQGTTVGLLHADASATGRTLDAIDSEVAARFAEGLGGVFERAVLRETLQLHHQELQSAIKWMSGRLDQLAADAVDRGAVAGAEADTALVETLTAREHEVMRLLARGHTNMAIANALVVREGTVKYHVKNILRKLGATSRADAVSRYVRAGAPEGGAR